MTIGAISMRQMVRLLRAAPIVLVFVVSTASCGRFWHDEIKTLATVWVDSTEFAIPQLSYQERKSWNPFTSNELRRNFRTSIQFMKREGESASPSGEKPIELKGTLISGPVRVFGGTLLVQRLAEEKAWIHELVYFAPGAPPRVLVKSGQRGATIRGILLSPDKTSVLLVYNVNSEQYMLMMLRKIPPEGEPAPNAEFVRVGGTPQIAWDPGSTKVYIKGADAMLAWDGRKVPQKVTTGPSCFYPPTRFGLSISDDGYTAQIGGPEGPRVRVSKRPDWIAHNRIPQNVKVEEIGKGCAKDE